MGFDSNRVKLYGIKRRPYLYGLRMIIPTVVDKDENKDKKIK